MLKFFYKNEETLMSLSLSHETMSNTSYIIIKISVFASNHVKFK